MKLPAIKLNLETIFFIISCGFIFLCFVGASFTLFAVIQWVENPGKELAKIAETFGAPPSGRPPSAQPPSGQSATTAAFDLAKIYFQALLGLLSTLLLAAGAYIVVTHAKNRNDRLQTSLARFKLVTELNQEIRSVYNSLAIYGALKLSETNATSVPEKPPADDPVTKLADSVLKLAEAAVKPAVDAAAMSKAIPLISVLDRNTVWLEKRQSEWNYSYGERTIRFVKESRFSRDAEVGTVVLHDYVHWFRRLRLGVDLKILTWAEVDIYWRYLVNFVRGRRFSFMHDIFGDDMRDYAYLISRLVVRESKLILRGSKAPREDLRNYIVGDGFPDPDPKLVENLDDEAKKLLKEYVIKRLRKITQKREK